MITPGRSRRIIKKTRHPLSDPIKLIAPDASADIQVLLRQLKSREVEIDRWFQEDPQRTELLATEAPKVIEELLGAMRLDRPSEVEWAKIPNWELVLQQPKRQSVGTALLTDVWQFVALSPNNLAQFSSDPFSVVNDVAASTVAPQAERDSVIAAFETVTGRRAVEFAVLSLMHQMAEETAAVRLPVNMQRVVSP